MIQRIYFSSISFSEVKLYPT